MSALISAMVVVACGSDAPAISTCVSDRVRLRQPAMIMVWEDGELTRQGDNISLFGAPPVRDETLMGSGDLIASEEVDQRLITIAVASNAPFEVHTEEAFAREDITVRVLGAAANAEINSGFEGGANVVFQQLSKTAFRPGLPSSQAITLEISWRGDTAPELFARSLDTPAAPNS